MKLNLIPVAKGAIYLMGFGIMVICTVLLPEIAREEAVGKVNPPITYPFFVASWIFSAPIFIALFETLKLLKLVEKNKAFSNLSVKALKNIKHCSIIFTLLVIVCASLLVIIGKRIDPSEDFAPVITIGFIFTFVSTVIATFVAVMQKLLQDAINMKYENDLIV